MHGQTVTRNLNVSDIIGAEGGIRLYNGTSPEEGTVENCRGGIWRAVCDINWSYQNSFVVCRELGLPATGTCKLM